MQDTTEHKGFAAAGAGESRHVGPAPGVLPEVHSGSVGLASNTGVSTRSARPEAAEVEEADFAGNADNCAVDELGADSVAEGSESIAAGNPTAEAKKYGNAGSNVAGTKKSGNAAAEAKGPGLADSPAAGTVEDPAAQVSEKAAELIARATGKAGADFDAATDVKSIDTATDEKVAKAFLRAARKKQWFVLKTTYCRERKANAYLEAQNIETFCPVTTEDREREGKKFTVTKGRLPNLLFAYGTERKLTPLVQQNPDVPYLRFYCRYSTAPDKPRRQIIIVPQDQMDSLMKICAAENQDTLLYTEPIHKFEKGDVVRVTEGPFAGVTGRVARFKGQQRVGLVIGDLLTAVTAYVPTSFLVPAEEESPSSESGAAPAEGSSGPTEE